MAGANVIRVPLGNDQAFLDRIEKMIEGLYPTPKLLILNYPHNPTAMTIEPDFWDRAIAMCRRHGIMIISDFAYGEICFDGYKAPSFLAAAGAKDLGVEFTTMSKSYNMAGWRIGFCAGNSEMVKALATIKGYYDYGIFAPIQIASIIAMREHAEVPGKQSKVYEQRRNVVCRGLDKLGWTYEKPRASMFVWAKIKHEHLKGQGTIDFCLRMMDEAQVALAPGRAFGENGEEFRPHRPGGKRSASEAGDGQSGARADSAKSQAQAAKGRDGVIEPRRRRGRRENRPAIIQPLPFSPCLSLRPPRLRGAIRLSGMAEAVVLRNKKMFPGDREPILNRCTGSGRIGYIGSCRGGGLSSPLGRSSSSAWRCWWWSLRPLGAIERSSATTSAAIFPRFMSPEKSSPSMGRTDCTIWAFNRGFTIN